ncbi:MAG TPA: BrnT family toxin [Bryobacteraceae bacterium]|nr:BrnT family toxin [Bryobacteraceae bacterium]
MDEASGVAFDWDAENTRHLRRHRVTPKEFEELMTGDPLYREYQPSNREERYKVLGATKAGRVLIAVFTLREGRVRAITAYAAGRAYQKLYWESAL